MYLFTVLVPDSRLLLAGFVDHGFKGPGGQAIHPPIGFRRGSRDSGFPREAPATRERHGHEPNGPTRQEHSHAEDEKLGGHRRR